MHHIISMLPSCKKDENCSWTYLKFYFGKYNGVTYEACKLSLNLAKNDAVTRVLVASYIGVVAHSPWDCYVLEYGNSKVEHNSVPVSCWSRKSVLTFLYPYPKNESHPHIMIFHEGDSKEVLTQLVPFLFQGASDQWAISYITSSFPLFLSSYVARDYFPPLFLQRIFPNYKPLMNIEVGCDIIGW